MTVYNQNNIFEEILYITMLKNFVDKYNQFNTGGLMEFSKELSPFDKKVIYNFPNFFENIKGFSLNNQIEMKEENDRFFYNIKIKDNYYQIGIYYTNDTIYYCQKIENCNEYIDINNYLKDIIKLLPKGKQKIRK